MIDIAVLAVVFVLLGLLFGRHEVVTQHANGGTSKSVNIYLTGCPFVFCLGFVGD